MDHHIYLSFLFAQIHCLQILIIWKIHSFLVDSVAKKKLSSSYTRAYNYEHIMKLMYMIFLQGHENKEAYLENEDLEEEHKGL